MIKNILLLSLLSWMSLAMARPEVVRESFKDATRYKVESSVEENEAQRSVAGEKIKRKAPKNTRSEEIPMSETEAEIRYWQYSEE